MHKFLKVPETTWESLSRTGTLAACSFGLKFRRNSAVPDTSLAGLCSHRQLSMMGGMRQGSPQ
jgi:hypothetical protein